METSRSGDAPGHGGGVVGQAEAAVGTEQDDASMAAESIVEVGNGLARGELRCDASADAVCSPLAEDQFHDGFAPAGERDGGGKIVSITAAANEG